MRLLHRLVLLLAVLLLPWACTDADKGPSGPSGSDAARLVLGATFDAMGGESAQDEIVRIRLTVRHAVTGAVLQDPVVENVDPDDPEWSIELQVPVPPDGAAVRVLIELIDATGETEWSGLTDPIQVRAGQTTTAPEPTIFPGPPGNLSVDSISVAPAADTLVENEAVQLTAEVFGGDPDSVRAVWATLTPELATVADDGTVTALLPGTARIEAAAGPARDTVTIEVLARISAVLLAPEAPVLDSVGAGIQMVATVVDARGEPVEGVGVLWASSDTTVVRHLGDGFFEAAGGGEAEITATVEGEEGVEGAAILTVRLSDLVPENLVITTPAPETIVEGDSLGVAIDVRNAGGTGAAASTLALRVLDAADPSVVVDDTLVAVPALEAGAIFSFSEVFGIEPGEWPDRVILEAVADADDDVTEADEANNGLRTGTFVVRRAVAFVTVTPTVDTIPVGDTARFDAQPFAADETPLDRPVTWEISAPAVATVDGSGLVTAAAVGTAQVLATSDGVTGSASVVVRDSLPTGFTKVWTGETGTDWATAGNWNPAGAPGSADTVLLPASAPVDPVLSAGGSVAGLTVQTGATLEVSSGVLLLVGGDLFAGNTITGAGTVVVSGASSTISGTVPNLRVEGAAVLGADVTVNGNLVVTGTGADLDVSGRTLSLTGNLSTASGGVLTMTEPSDTVRVSGSATFAGGSTDGRLVDGLLEISGSFSQSTSSAAFSATGNHRTRILDATASVGFTHPGDGAGFSHFAHLDVVGTSSDVTPTSSVFTAGDLHIAGGATWNPGGARMHVGGAFTMDLLSTATFPYLRAGGTFTPDPSWALAFDTLELAGTGQTVPTVFPIVLLRVSGTAGLSGPTSVDEVTIGGPGAELDVAGQSLTISGPLTTSSGGVLRMQSASDTVLVGGNAVFSGGSTAGLLTAGVLRVSGDFMQTGGAADAFAAGGGHTTEFDGSVAQTVSFASPGAGMSHFGRVRVTRPFLEQVMFSTDVRGDTLVIVTGSVGIPAGTTATFTGDVSAIDSNLGGPGRLEVGGVIHGSGDSILGVAWLAVAGGFNLAPGDIPADTIVLRGTAGQPIDTTVVYQHLVVEGTTAVYEDFVADETLSSLVITGSGAHFSPGACQRLQITGLLRTENGGVLEMDGGECDDEIDVHGDAEFFGGSTAGLLNAGILRVRGDFMQGGDPESFVAGAGVQDTLTVRLGGTAPQTITFSNPGTSRFHHLEVDTALATPTLGSNAVVGGNLTVLLGTIDPGSSRLDILGDLRTTNAFRINGGTLTMSDGIVDVGGNATFQGGSTVGSLTGGLLILRGNFTQLVGDTISTGFHASGTHVTRFAGPAGAGLNQVVSFASPGSTLSRFNHLEIRNTPGVGVEEVRLEGDVHVGGALDVGASDGSIASNLNLVTGTTTVVGDASLWTGTFTTVDVEATLSVTGLLLLDAGATLDILGQVIHFGGFDGDGGILPNGAPLDGNAQ